MLTLFKEKVQTFISSYKPGVNHLETGVRGVSIYVSSATGEMRVEMYEAAVCLVLQGSKVTRYGANEVTLSAGQAAVVSHDVPVLSNITSASDETPYIALILKLDQGKIRELNAQISEIEISQARAKLISTGEADKQLISSLYNLFCLRDSPLERRVLTESLSKQVHFHVLVSPMGAMSRQLHSDNSHVERVSRAIRYIYENYLETITVQELALKAGMSQSTFFKHFKEVTSMTPLDFQKELRLSKAFSLLREGGVLVTTAAYAVGYNSATQFSREFSRKFGCSPGAIKEGKLPSVQMA